MHFLVQPDTLQQQGKRAAELCAKCMVLMHTTTDPRLMLQIFDTMSNQLCLVMDAAEFVRNIHPDENYHQSAMQAFLHLMEYMNVLNTSHELYDKVSYCSSNTRGVALTEEEVRCIEVFKQDMESNGITLPDDVRELVARFRTEIEEVGSRLLAGQGLSGQQQQATILELKNKRHELASVLEEPSFAHNAMANTLAASPENVWRFLAHLAAQIRPQIEREMALLRQVKYDNMTYLGKATTREEAVVVQDHEVPELVSKYIQGLAGGGAVGMQAIRDYLPLEACWAGLLALCERVFGVQFQEAALAKHEAWSPDVRKYAVYHAEQGYLGVLYVDLFARSSKLGAAGHLTVQGACQAHVQVLEQLGETPPTTAQPAVLVLTCSFRPEGPGGQVLLWPHEVETLFHEMGHALHTFCGRAQYQNLTGTRSSVDFVEFPSQLMELFARDYRVLSTFARHHRTGERLSREVWKAAFTAHFPGVTTLSEIMQASMDQLLHSPAPWCIPTKDGGNVTLQSTNPEDAIIELAKIYVGLDLSKRGCSALGFGGLGSVDHFINYPGIYYSYLYSKSFSKRVWHRYFEEDPFNAIQGERFRSEVLAFAATRHPKVILSNYLGEDPDPSNFVEDW